MNNDVNSKMTTNNDSRSVVSVSLNQPGMKARFLRFAEIDGDSLSGIIRRFALEKLREREAEEQ